MTLIDGIMLLILLAAVVIGYSKGLLRQLSSLLSWAIGIVASVMLGNKITQVFLVLFPSAADWPLSSVTVKVVAVAMFFLCAMLVIRLFMRLLRGMVKAAHAGFIDRIGGVLLFVFEYLFVLSIVLNVWFAIKPSAEVFKTRHALNNAPFEFTLDLMPTVLGTGKTPSDSLPLYHELPQIQDTKTTQDLDKS